ncbi:alpha/beta hydrolase [uncultured Roseovarius sp.]|uniref:alpha/beta hydrolase n=1 Tax=uncultured Roseovarius sp. TaxID=293344 RepID=UPI00261D6B28|nr:alpha/beta hydrolase [uncultured Roseovarius sp.]
MSIRQHLLNCWLRTTEKPTLERASHDRIRRRFERKARTFLRSPKGTVFDIKGVGGTAGSVPTLSVEASDDGPLILYFHGGGYVFGSAHTHRALVAWVSHYTDLSAAIVSYRRAPEDRFPTALLDAVIAYRFVRNAPNGIIIGGDSAGGGMALALLGEISRLGLPQPLGTFVMSPLTDLTFSGDSFRDNERLDVVLPAKRASELARLYLNGADPTNPRASPLFADFTGAGPVWMVASDREILLDDTLRMAEKLKKQGVDVTCKIESNLPHVWPLFQGYLPEADDTLRDLAGWIKALSPRSSDS